MFKNGIKTNVLTQNLVVYDEAKSSGCTLSKSGFARKMSGPSLDKLVSKFRAINERRAKQGLSLLVLAIPLSACGGSDSTPATEVEVTGRAIDGYLANSKVFLTSNPDVFVQTSNDAGQQGKFSGLFGSGSIVVKGGTDISTGKTFTGELRAPEGSTVVTPLTTIVDAVVQKAVASGGAPVSAAEAQAQVAKGLGLSEGADLMATDFVATGSAGMSKAAAQVANLISMVSAAGGTDAAAAVMAEVSSKIAAAGSAGGKSEVLTKASELKAILETVSSTTDVFADAPGFDNLAAVIDNIATVAETVNAKIEVATSLKDIAATQQAVQEDFVTSISAGVVVDVAAIDTLIAEATAELDVYIESLGDDAGFDFTAELDVSDVDTTIQVVVISEDGTISVPDIPDGVEIPDDVVIPVAGGGGGASGATITEVVAAGGSISDALTAAQAKVSSSADTIVISLSSGRYSENVTIDADALGVASVTIAGANVGKSLAVDISGNITTGLSTAASTVQTLYDTDNVARGVAGGALETWIDGKITVASDNVVLDGLRLHSYNGGLDFSGNDIDNFTLQNSYVTGFSGANSVRYTGDTTDGTNTGWVLKGNMIGGVSGGTGGSLYLENMSGASIEANTFFRPGAAHMYLTDTDNVTVKSNFFYHGLHADGANFDSSLADFQGAADEGYGYVGFNGDAGSGYGGYGFGYGYSASDASFTQMGSYGGYGGYGPSGYAPSGYGLDGYGGGGANQASYLFYGRNYVAEVKGDSDTVVFDGNWGAYNSGGIQFWDEGDASHSFNNTKIQNNQMSNFVNADQDGLLDAVSSRHKSGIEGGVVFQVKDGSTSSSLLIKGNEIYGDIGQILNDNDLDALIEVGGGVEGVVIDGNTLEWSGTVSSSERISTDDVINQGILLYGDINEEGTSSIIIKDNVFETTSIPTNYQSSAIFLDTSAISTIGTLSSDVLITDADNATFTDWQANPTDLGNYKTAGDKMYDIGQTASVYGTADATSGLSFETGSYDYSAIII